MRGKEQLHAIGNFPVSRVALALREHQIAGGILNLGRVLVIIAETGGQGVVVVLVESRDQIVRKFLCPLFVEVKQLLLLVVVNFKLGQLFLLLVVPLEPHEVLFLLLLLNLEQFLE